MPLVFAVAPKALVAECILIGIGLMLYELMLWYVLVDSRRLGFNAWRWSITLLLLNVVGLVAYLICSAARTGDWKRAALPIAYILEGVIVVGLLLIPLIRTQALPDMRWRSLEILRPPSAPRSEHLPVRQVRVRVAPPKALFQPDTIPTKIPQLREEQGVPKIAAPEIAFVPGAVPDGRGSGSGTVLFGLLTGDNSGPPRIERPKVSETKRIPVGGVVQAAKLIFHPNPEYPPLARMARIQGIVRLEAIISKDGAIQMLKAVSGHPLLLNAAVEAVGRWRYHPTLLNGEPVEVSTEIEVNFILSE